MHSHITRQVVLQLISMFGGLYCHTFTQCLTSVRVSDVHLCHAYHNRLAAISTDEKNAVSSTIITLSELG